MYTRDTLLARLQASRIFRFLVFALSACVFAFALHLAWLAFTTPVELEVREGSTWLHVLAKRAGVDIYDTRRVAFVNMNHGPFDAIVKAWISRCVPVMPGYMVSRIFVLFSPVFLFAGAYLMTRRHLAAALLAAGALFLLFCQMSLMTLVGRPDAFAICGLAVCGLLVHRLLVSRHRSWSNHRYIVTQVGLGAMSAAIFLSTWRFAPILAALQAVVLSTQLVDNDAYRRWSTRWLVRLLARLGIAAKNVVVSSALYLAGFAAIWVPVFLFELHGDFRSYYRHFFGFFLGASGWGIYAGSTFHLLPDELLKTRHASMLLLAAVMIGGLYRLRRAPGQLIVWLLMLAAVWLAVAYGYFKNQGGGGLYYFFEFLAFAWIFILHAFCRRRRWGTLAQLALVCAVGFTMPWRDLLAQRELLLGARKQGRIFREHVANVTHGQPVFSEETHLFKSVYQGEVVDTGDATEKVAASGYFGEAFGRTYDAYTRNLVTNPPKFIIGGLLEELSPRIISSSLQELLRTRYKLRVAARRTGLACGSSQGLFERND